MSNPELIGIHHVTAMTNDAVRNYEFFHTSTRYAFS